MTLPQDGHVHTEWSWDTDVGSMERSCARAVEFGVPSIAFTEHADFTEYRVTPQDTFQPPALDVAGYLACVRQCRERFPGLRILSGVELGEPHWHAERVQTLLSTMDCDRLLGSVHTVRIGGDVLGIPGVYRIRPAAEAVRLYLAEVLRLVETSSVFGVLAHIDFAVRYWPQEAGPFDPAGFEEEFRAVLRALARTDRVLEVNSEVPLHPRIVRWWHDVGGAAVCFGSDAHDPSEVARRFADTTAMAQAQGFRAGDDPHAFWVRA